MAPNRLFEADVELIDSCRSAMVEVQALEGFGVVAQIEDPSRMTS